MSGAFALRVDLEGAFLTLRGGEVMEFGGAVIDLDSSDSSDSADSSVLVGHSERCVCS